MEAFKENNCFKKKKLKKKKRKLILVSYWKIRYYIPVSLLISKGYLLIILGKINKNKSQYNDLLLLWKQHFYLLFIIS